MMKILDKDCWWKLYGTPLSTVISYLESFPKEAEISLIGNEKQEEYAIVLHEGEPKECLYPYETKFMTRDFLWTEIKWGRKLPYTTFDGNQHFYGYFEQWSDETDYHCEGGLWYSFRDKKPILDDYDGVFSLPAEVKAFLIGAGFEVDESA
jgi:hypothetical protein